MSTRGLVGYIRNNQFKGTYNHFNSYPDGLGEEVVVEIRKIKDWENFKNNYDTIKWVKDNYIPTEEEIQKCLQWYNKGVNTGKKQDVYALLTELQGAPQVELIDQGKIILLIDGSSFIKDSLFCEYVYVINMDTMELEFYEGFQKESQPGNRFGETPDKEYYPCKLVGSYPLIDIPDNWAELYEVDEEEL